LGIPEWLRGAAAAAVVLVALASFPAVIWFFHFRRRMIRRIAWVARDLEEALRPRDKRYWYLGYLVGFRARYWVNRGPVTTAAALYIIPPYHVFFYLPVVILARRRERLDLAVALRSTGIGGEAHIVDPSDRGAVGSLRADGVDTSRLRRGSVALGGRVLEAYHTGGGGALEEARRLAGELEGLGARVRRVTVDAGRARIYVSLTPPQGGPVAPLAEAVLRAAARAARGAAEPGGGAAG